MCVMPPRSKILIVIVTPIVLTLFALGFEGRAAGDSPLGNHASGPGTSGDGGLHRTAPASGMEDADPDQQNFPSPEEIRKHFIANGWTNDQLASIPLDEIASMASSSEQAITCPCGCPPQSVYDCTCKTAAMLRGRVIDSIASLGVSKFDLRTVDGRRGAARETMRVITGHDSNAQPAGLSTAATCAAIAFVIVAVIVLLRRLRHKRLAA